MALISGTRLGAYEVVSPLGAGGMGEVYLARDTKLGRRVALKVLPDLFVQDADRVARFEREAKMLAALNHPHIAALHGMDQAAGRHFLVMELIEGETLAEHLHRGPMPANEALIVARQIAEALEAAHEKGVIHRDLKPANVKLTPDDQVKVLDFGLAKAVDRDAGSSNVANSPTLSMMASQAGLILGTAAYMSPEQAKGLPADQRSDIFSFGTVLYEMLTGRQPFQGETAPDVLASVLVREPDLKSLPPQLHPRLVDLLRRCLEKHPKKRWQAIGDVRAEIETIQATSTATIEAGAPATLATPLLRRLVPFVATALVAAGITAAVAAWLLARPATVPPPVSRFDISLPDPVRLSGRAANIVAISPDGQQIVLTANGRLFVRALDEVTAKRIEGVDEASSASSTAVSPNGRFVVFWTGGRALHRIAISGGAPVTLCTAEAPLGVTWGSHGILYGQSTGIWRVAAEGGKPELLIPVKDGELFHGPQILPDGEHVLFTVSTGSTAEQWDRAAIVVQSLRDGTRTRLIEGGADGRYLSPGYIVYAVGGTIFGAPFDAARRAITGPTVPVIEGVRRSVAAVSGSAQYAVADNGTLVYLPGAPGTTAGQLDLALVDRAGVKQMLKLPPAAYEYPRISLDGTRVAFGTDNGRESVIWIYPLNGTSTMSRLTFTGANRYPIWAPDGLHITFQSDRQGDRGLFRQRADGVGDAERLTKAAEGDIHFPDLWSPDGKYLLYTVKTGPRFALWLWSAADRQAKPWGGVQSFALPTPSLSPDARWLAYTEGDSNTNSTNVFVQPFPSSGAKYQLLAKFGDNPHHPLWTPDKKELLYVPRVGGFEAAQVIWQPSVAFGNGTPVPRVFPTAAPTTPRTFDITPDGKIVSPTMSVSGLDSASDAETIRVVLNWHEDVKARLAIAK